MNGLPRKKITELIARYTLEPNIKDIYVEGDFDRDIVKYWFSANKIAEPVVFPIKIVDIPDDCLEKYSMTSGNKQRVIALSRELSLCKGRGYICLVDLDYDEINKVEWGESYGLQKTDYCSLELYYYEPELLLKVMMVCGVDIQNQNLFLTSFESVLRKIFSIRAALERLKWNISWVDVEKNLSVNGESIHFDSTSFISKILMNGGKLNNIAEFNKVLLQIESELNTDARMSIRGHDFTSMIAFVAKKLKGKKEFYSDSAVERLFIMEHEMIDALINRLINSFP